MKYKYIFGLNKVPKKVLIGLLGVILMYISVAGAYSSVAPWMLRGDTKQHVDYVWVLYNGHLPKWEDGIKYKPFIESGWGNSRQSAAANPPLFYMIHAPFEGHLLNNGEWREAIAIGRTINIIFGVICVFVLAWGAWLYGGRKKELLAVAVPALAVLTFRFTRLNLDFALDALLLIFSTLSLILNYKLLVKGPQKKYLIWLFVVSILGMATKAPYILFLLINMIVVILAYIVHGEYGERKLRLIKGAIISGSLFVVVAASIGWYYYLRDYKTNGTWFSVSPSNYSGGRPYQSLFDVLKNGKFWGLLCTSYSKVSSLSAAITSFAVAGWLLVDKKRVVALVKDRKKSLAYATLVLAVAGTFIIQLKFAVGYGSINFRYMIPALLPMSLFLSYGLLKFEWLRGQLLTLAAVSMGISSFMVLDDGKVRRMYSDVAQNGIPSIFLTLLFIMFIAGACLLAFSMYGLTKKVNNKKS